MLDLGWNLNPMMGVREKRRTFGHTQRRQPREDKGEIGVIQLQTKGGQLPTEAGSEA